MELHNVGKGGVALSDSENLIQIKRRMINLPIVLALESVGVNRSTASVLIRVPLLVAFF